MNYVISLNTIKMIKTMCTAPQKVPTYITQNTGTLKKEMLKGSERREVINGDAREGMEKGETECLKNSLDVCLLKALYCQ